MARISADIHSSVSIYICNSVICTHAASLVDETVPVTKEIINHVLNLRLQILETSSYAYDDVISHQLLFNQTFKIQDKFNYTKNTSKNDTYENLSISLSFFFINIYLLCWDKYTFCTQKSSTNYRMFVYYYNKLS
jgi:hypothetical protein